MVRTSGRARTHRSLELDPAGVPTSEPMRNASLPGLTALVRIVEPCPPLDGAWYEPARPGRRENARHLRADVADRTTEAPTRQLRLVRAASRQRDRRAKY